MTNNAAAPNLILLNGDFRTLDLIKPNVRAVAVSASRIIAVGSDDEIQSLAGPGTESMDLGGRLGLPGMTDSHFHFYDWALGRRNLVLADVRFFGELIDRVAAAVRNKPPGSWILGQGWNEADWPENRIPTKTDLDAAAPDHPVMLWRCDLHLAVVNSKALELAGIHEGTPDPPEGVIGRDENGYPNGILREMAPNLIKSVITELSEDETVEAMCEGISVLHGMGLTGLNDVRIPGGVEWVPAFRGWQRIGTAGKLDLRCWASIPCERLNEAISLGLRTGFGDDRLRIGHIKFFADGGMGARTAWMIDPYLDADLGMPLAPMAELAEAVYRADQAGLAVMIHAIGERANRELITLFEELEGKKSIQKNRKTAKPLLPHRIEHVQMIRPEDLARLARLNVVACVQPHNMILDINMIDKCVGPRGKWTYPYRAMLDAGIRVLLSSDCPVCSPSPLVAIHAAVTRQREDGSPQGGWYPEHRISVEEAVRALTIAPAYAYGLEDELGSITPGKKADLIVLDRDIYAVDPMDIIHTKVDLTIFDGRIVHRGEQF